MATRRRARRSMVSTAPRILVPLVVLATGFSGCGLLRGDPPPMLPVNAPANAKALEGIHEQEPEWVDCEDRAGFQCTEITVPINYAEPDGDTMVVAVNRLPATGKGRKLGALVVLPPRLGESGRDYLFSGEVTRNPTLKALRQNYDLVSLDPRGVGASTAVTCLNDEEQESFYDTDLTPDTDKEHARAVAAVESYAEKCAENSEGILPHVGIENVSRDLDILRVALDQRKLNFLSWRQGAMIGQNYAAQYPQNVGRMVLDSVAVARPQANPADAAIQRGEAMDAALEQIFEACLRSGDTPCPIGGTVKEAEDNLDELLVKLERRPVNALGDRKLTETRARIAALAAIADPARNGPVFTMGVAEARRGHGQFLMSLADTYLRRGPDGVYSTENASEYAVTCLIGVGSSRPSAASESEEAAEVQNKRTASAMDAAASKASEESPHFGALGIYLDGPCAFWPVPPTTRHAEFRSNTKAPIVLVGRADDPRSPLEDLRRVNADLGSASLVVAGGDKTYGQGDSCVDQAVNAFLIDGKRPEKEQRCP
ncbi:MAG TPA: alpha/beta fold hydrolase [Actinopolymorphaceae bacterium]